MHRIYLPIISSYKPRLKTAFAHHGIEFGFSVSSGSFVGKITRPIIIQHASVVATENALKMEVTQPKRGVFNFGEADLIVERASKLSLGIYGHALSWSLQNPSWLVDGNFTAGELEAILRQHVGALSSRYGAKLTGLDAANEGFISKGPWSPMGNSYINISLECARHSCPVLYNSFFSSDSEYWKTLVLFDTGKIDAIGIQLHLHYMGWERMIERTDGFLSSIRARGSWARFSEVGVLAPEPLQATIYAAVTRLAIKYKDIVHDFIVWGITDPAWRGDVTLFNNEGNPKLGYYAMMEALKR